MTIEEVKNLPPLKMVAMTKEEFNKFIQPFICEQCRRIFNPTEEEKKQLAKAIEDIDDISFEWEVIIK